MEKFQNKYRIPSARAAWWDYANPGAYFITICTHDRKHLFGQIYYDEMYLSPIGQIVDREWNKSFEIRAELFCDAWIIMPNHIHAILRIEPTNGEIANQIQTHGDGQMHGDGSTHDQGQTHGRASLSRGVAYRSPKSISSFVAGFKSAATTRINQYRNTPKQPIWQTRFHDHIIRNDTDYTRIATYIEQNPSKWMDDKFFRNG